jgi:hypothetical protein
MYNNENAMATIEQLCCDAANEIEALRARKNISVEELYTSTPTPRQKRVLAQNFAFHTMRVRFGFSYSIIAQRAGYSSEKVVMRGVKTLQDSLRLNDCLYCEMNSIVNRKLAEKYGE